MSLFESHIPFVLKSAVSLVEAPTGTGKSTLFPLAILKQKRAHIILVQPRRAAARMLAHRMAFLLKESCGQTVGYHIRHEKVESPSTMITVVTEGILLRRLQNDPFLDGVDIVILDEFHERSTQLDLLLLFLNDVQTANDCLKLVLTSASLDAAHLLIHFPDAYHAQIDAKPSGPFHASQPRAQKKHQNLPLNVYDRSWLGCWGMC